MKINIKSILSIVLFLLVALYIYDFASRTINGDESILAEHAKKFATEGHVSSPMFTGMEQGWETLQLHYHKLFILTGALVYKLFGTSIYAFRSISLVYFILMIYVFYIILKRDENIYIKFGIILILLLANYTFFIHGLIYRPETSLAFYCLLSFYLLSRGMRINSVYPVIFSGISAGLGVLTHLNGLSILFAGSVLLFWKKKYKFLFIFIATGVLISFLYFFDINTKQKLFQFLQQFKLDPNLRESDFSMFGPFLKIIEEHKRFFWNPSMAIFTVSIITVLFLSAKHLWKNNKSIIIFTIFLIIGLAGISHGKTIKYALIYIPFLTIILTYGLIYIYNHGNRTKRIVIFSVLSLYLIVNIYNCIDDSLHFINSVRRSEMLTSKLKENNSNIFSPAYLYFNQDSNFNIRIPLAYIMRNEVYKKGECNPTDFYNYNKINNNKYIILDKLCIQGSIEKASGYDTLKMNELIYSYKVIDIGPDYKILKLEQ